MTDLTPKVQQLLEKLSKEFSQEELPAEITIDQNGIQVSTSKKNY
jgi:ligand-binding sensor protein